VEHGGERLVVEKKKFQCLQSIIKLCSLYDLLVNFQFDHGEQKLYLTGLNAT
jgi:hypothetical protein